MEALNSSISLRIIKKNPQNNLRVFLWYLSWNIPCNSSSQPSELESLHVAANHSQDIKPQKQIKNK